MSQRTFAFMNRVLTYDMRSISPSLYRLFALTLTIILIYIVQKDMSNRTDQGLVLFQMITYANLFFIGFVCLKDYASVITEEKEHHMLGLLLMTGINPLGILLGKSIPRQINSLLLLTIQFPFTLLAITLGGVTLEQVLAVYCTLVATLFFVANLCLLCSVLSEDSKSARGSAFTILVLISVAPGIISLIGAFTFDFLIWIGVILNIFQPVTRLVEIMQTGFNGSAFGIQFYAHLIAGSACIFLSWLVFENLIILNESKESSQIEKSRPFKSKRKKKKSIKNQLLKRPSDRSWENALAWKHYHFSMGGSKAFRKRFLVYILGILVLGTISFFTTILTAGFNFNFSQWIMGLGISIQGVSGAFLLLEPLMNLNRGFSEEFQKNTYPGIYMLPLSLKRTTWNMFKGGISFMIPSALFFCIGFLLYPKGVLDLFNSLSKEHMLIKASLISISFYLVLLLAVVSSSLFTMKGSSFSNWSSFKSQGLFALLFSIYAFVIYLIFYMYREKAPNGYEFLILNTVFVLVGLKLIQKSLISRAAI